MIPHTLRRYSLLCCLIAFTNAASFVHAQDMPLSQVLIDGEPWQLVGEGYQFTEAPAVNPDGVFYFVDVSGNKIYRLNAEGKPEVFVEDSGKASGLMFGADGRLYACQNGGRKIVAYDSAGQATTIADDVDCNDLVVAGNGAMYFTDPKHKQVWYVSPAGEKRVVDEGIELPNGIILWPDQKSLVVSDTRTLNLWVFRIEKDGSLSFKQPYYTMQDVFGRTDSGADGMTVDREGRLFVATYAGLQVFDTQGRLSGVILKPQDKFLSNVVFAGSDLKTLYVTCTDKVYKRLTKVQGLRYSDGK
jgi:gluconolactonase